MLTAVVEHDLNLALADKNTIVMQMMNMPALDFSRTDGELVHADQRIRKRSGVRGMDFAQRAAIIHVSNGGSNDDAVDEPR